MERDELSVKRKTIDLEKGIYLIRYAMADDPISHPSVNIAVDGDDHDAISFILQRDSSDTVLWQPGTSVAVRAMTPGRLHVEIVPSHSSGSAGATIKIEPLTQGSNAFLPMEAESAHAPAPRAATPGGFRVLGHLAGRGDVYVPMSEWLGGPTAPTRIEGIAFEWPQKPRGLELSYSVRVEHPGGASSPKVKLGAFAGSRGRALPVVEMTLELSGAEASLHALSVDAIFLGCSLQHLSGPKIALRGPTGYEPLVGLRLKIEPHQISSLQQSAQQGGLAAQKSGHVRVFRSRNRVSFA